MIQVIIDFHLSSFKKGQYIERKMNRNCIKYVFLEIEHETKYWK